MSYPLLDSFPRIFPHASASIAVRSSLETNTSIASNIKDMRSIVSRAAPLDEREALSNTLGSIAEQYQEGWDSGSDEDDD